MRRKLDPETEELLWVAAESDDPAVVEEFERRFPDLRPELATRRVMVEVIRKSRPEAGRAVRSSFEPTPSARSVFARRAVWVPAMAALLAVLSFGAYKTTQYFVDRGREDSGGQIGVSGPPPPAPVIDGDSGGRGSPMDITESHPETGKPYGIGERPPNPVAPQQLVTLPAQTTLLAALDQFVKQTGIRVDVLPGVTDAPIRIFDGEPGQSIHLPVGEALRTIERAAGVRILDNGAEGFLVFPPAGGEGTPFGGFQPRDEDE